MPIEHYGVLKGHPVERAHSTERHPHYQIRLTTSHGQSYRVAIRARSFLSPPEMIYKISFNYRHPIIHQLRRLEDGFHPITSGPGGLAIDYLRLNLFDRERMLSLPCTGPGCGDDLNEVLDAVFKSAITDPHSRVYVYGEPWESDKPDHVFRFHPSRGMHDVHMNQGNAPGHWDQDGVWQDGGVFIEHPDQERWVGIFLAFQSQSWHTDDETGHALTPHFFHEGDGIPVDRYGERRPEGMVRIIAARVRTDCTSAVPFETVTLLNISPITVSLHGWSLVNSRKQRWRLKGEIPPGETLEVRIGQSMALTSDEGGGIITLTNKAGIRIHGVSFTAEEPAATAGAFPFGKFARIWCAYAGTTKAGRVSPSGLVENLKNALRRSESGQRTP